MATQVFAKSESQLDTYLPAYKNILSATGFVGVEIVDKKTGEVRDVIKPFSAEQKLVWLYVLDRYKFFTDDKRAYFDNQVDIAKACGVSERTVLRFFKDLSLSGYLQITQTRIGGHKSNSYIVTKDLVLVQKEEDASKAPANPSTQRSDEKATNIAPDVESVPMALTDDYSYGAEVKGHLVEEIPDACYDDYSFEEQEENTDAYLDYADTDLTAAPAKPASLENKAPASLDHIDLRTMPRLICHPNGVMTAAMMDWFEDRGFYIEDTADWIVHLKGSRFKFESRNFKYLGAVEEIVFQAKEEEDLGIPF
ncbi:DUF6945 domain-containing protein [Pseudomonas luteola]|uniref:DUF6945 domain-containing protein n=1 Tax=Pseudomonas luteola TaxID=47886 RepID=A0ABS0FIE3_PSELU|nr:hypothetical protein [Pseudomonas zeshuii]MBF8640115.1 hypothetical protein [Pseudomonas zeshuii]